MTAVEAARGVRIGPEGVPDPRRTLGWAVLGWTAEMLEQPDGPGAGSPWMFTPEQARFVLWWYAIDERGRFVYRRGILRRMKGWGKDPVGAALCCVEFVGPCRFGGFDDDGTPIVVEHAAAWVQTAAVSKDQTRNTMTLFPGMFSQLAIEEYGIDLGKEIIYAHGGRCRLEAVTSSPRALEGGRATFVLKNESHHWITANEGHAMAAVIDRNAAKSRDGSSRVLAISNAHNPGEDSDAERDYEAWLKISTGKSRATGFLYDSLEAPGDTELAPVGTGKNGEVTARDVARARRSLRRGLLAARGDSEWLDVERLIEEIYDPKTAPSTSRRFYLNQIVAAEDAWLDPREYEGCVERGNGLVEGEMVTVGFDGSKSNDHTALVLCRVGDGKMFKRRIWDPGERADGEVPMAEVDGEVRQVFERFDVVGFYSDYHPFESYVDRWEQDLAGKLCVKPPGSHPIRWVVAGDGANRQEITRATDAYHDAIVEKVVKFEEDQELRQHHLNARRRPNMYGVAIGKESAFSSRKMDGAMAGLLAWKARQDYLALPEAKKRQVAKVAGAFWA